MYVIFVSNGDFSSPISLLRTAFSRTSYFLYYFDARATFSEQVFLQSNPVLPRSHFNASTQQPLLESRKFIRQLLFGTTILLAEELFRIKISTKVLHFQSRYFCTASAFSEELHFRKRSCFGKEIFCITYISWRVIFLEWLIFQKIFYYSSYRSTRASFTQHTFSEELLFHNYISSPQLHLLFIIQ